MKEIDFQRQKLRVHICLPHVRAKWGGVTEARFSSGEEVRNWALTGLTVLLPCTGNLISHGLRQQESINEYHQTVREGFELLRSGWEPLGILLIVSCCGKSGQLMNSLLWPLKNYVNGAWIVQFREMAEKIITESACPMRVTRKSAFSCKEKHILSFAFKDFVPMKKVSSIV